MSNAYTSLKKAKARQIRPPLGPRLPSIIKMNEEKKEVDNDLPSTSPLPPIHPENGVKKSNGWEQKPNWSTDNPEQQLTTEDNFDMRLARVHMTLPHVLKNIDDLIEHPNKYLYDIKLMRYLSSSKHNTTEDYLKTSHEVLYNEGLPQLIKLYWKKMHIVKVKDMSNVNAMRLEVFYHLLMALWFQSMRVEWRQILCDEMCTFCVEVSGSEGFKVYFRKKKRQTDTLKAILGILYQYAKNLDAAGDLIRSLNGTDIMNRIITTDGFNRNVTGRASLILAYILTEQEQKSLSTTESNIDFLLYLLAEACKQPDHKSPQYNYTALEIIEGLNQLAVCDSNKVKIFYGGVIDSVKILLGSTSTVEEQEEGCKNVWTLTFDNFVREELLKDETTISLLRSLTSSTSDSVRMAAGGALWSIEQSHKQKEQIIKSSDGHIMMSYNWAVQETALKLKAELETSGYSVWMDVENMSGSTLAAMSDAVEHSAIVLVLFSEKYKISPACRSEAEYTYRLRKDFIPVRVQSGYVPDGWLGMLIGTKMFYDLSILDKWEEHKVKLCEEIGQRGKGPPITSVGRVQSGSHRRAPAPVVTPMHEDITSDVQVLPDHPDDLIMSKECRYLELECKMWNNTQVEDWINLHGLREIIARAGEKLIGRDLAELKNLQYYSGDEFIKVIKSELKVTFGEILRLGHAVRTLR